MMCKLPNPLIRLVGIGLVVDGARRITSRRASRRDAGSGAAGLRRSLGVLEIGLALAILERAPIPASSLYRHVASIYDPLTPIWRDWLYRDASVAFDGALRASCRPGDQVLDLCCGTGAVLERLRAVGVPFGSYTGVDQSSAMLERARSKFGALPGVHLEHLDLRQDPLPVGPFDLITSAWALEHLPEPGQIVALARARLRDGGRLVLLFEADGHAWRERLVRRVWRFFDARLVPELEYSAWPGRISLRRFGGAGPTVVVLTLAADGGH